MENSGVTDHCRRASCSCCLCPKSSGWVRSSPAWTSPLRPVQTSDPPVPDPNEVSASQDDGAVGRDRHQVSPLYPTRCSRTVGIPHDGCAYCTVNDLVPTCDIRSHRGRCDFGPPEWGLADDIPSRQGASSLAPSGRGPLPFHAACADRPFGRTKCIVQPPQSGCTRLHSILLSFPS